jgi:hypothetical protein
LSIPDSTPVARIVRGISRRALRDLAGRHAKGKQNRKPLVPVLRALRNRTFVTTFTYVLTRLQ